MQDVAAVVAEQETASRTAAETITPGRAAYDVIVVGSGAAGGMAAYQLATAGVKVLLLEAGRLLDPHARVPDDGVAVRDTAARQAPGRRVRARRRRIQHGRSAVRRTARDSRSTGRCCRTRATRSRATGWSTSSRTRRPARATRGSAPACSAGRRTCGAACRCGCRTSTSRRPAATASARTGRFRTPTSPRTTTRWTSLLGISGTKENIPSFPTACSSAALKLNCGELILKRAIAKMGRHLIPGPRRRHDRRRRQQVPQPVHGTRPLRARLRPQRADALADGAHLSGARYRQPDPPAEFDGLGSAGRSRATNRASGVRVIDSDTREVFDFNARVVILAASTLESTRLLLLSKSAEPSRTAWRTRRARSATTSASTSWARAPAA